MASILKVNTIQDATNSTTAISVDTAGRVTTPARPAFMVGVSSTYSHTSGNTIQYDTTSGTGGFDNGNNFDLSNYKFVVPVNGQYQFYASFSLQSGERTRSANCRLAIGGSTIDARFGARDNLDGTNTGGSSYLNLRGLWLLNLTASQEISWKASWETDDNMDSSENIHLHGSYCWGMLVG